MQSKSVSYFVRFVGGGVVHEDSGSYFSWRQDSLVEMLRMLISDPRPSILTQDARANPPSVLVGSGRGKFVSSCCPPGAWRLRLIIAILLQELPGDAAHAPRHDHNRRVGFLAAGT